MVEKNERNDMQEKKEEFDINKICWHHRSTKGIRIKKGNKEIPEAKQGQGRMKKPQGPCQICRRKYMIIFLHPTAKKGKEPLNLSIVEKLEDVKRDVVVEECNRQYWML